MNNKRMKSLIKYHSSFYFRSNRIMMPLLVYVIYLFVAYKVGPVEVVSSMALSSGVLFFLMVWIGFSYSTVQNVVSEELVILKIKSHKKYYASEFMFVALLALGFSILGVIFPFVWNLLRHSHLFARSIIASDVFGGFVLHIVLAFLGVTIGLLFHPRMIKNRKLAIVFAFFYALMGYVKGPMGTTTPITKAITWIFPPFYELLLQATKQSYFNMIALSIPIVACLCYLGVYVVIYIAMLSKRKF